MNLRSKYSILFYLITIKLISCIQQIEIGKQYDVLLGAEESQQYKLIIKETLPQNSQLFISAYSPAADPTQQPIAKIKYNQTQQTCIMYIQELDDVCMLTADKITKQMQVTINLTCTNQCHAKLYLYISQTIQLDIGERQYIVAGQNPIQKVIKVNVQKQLYDSVMVLAKDQSSSLDMYVNFGINPEIPVKQKNRKVPEKSWSDTKALVIPSGSLPGLKNSTIMVLLSIQAYGFVEFWTQIVGNNLTHLSLSTQYDDYLEKNKEKTYFISLPNDKFNNQKNLLLIFSVYSGDPIIEIANSIQFKSNKKLPQNFGSVMLYEIGYNQLKDDNFENKIYIKVKANQSSTFSITGEFKKKSNTQLLTLQKTRYLSIQQQFKVIIFRDFVQIQDKVQYFVYYSQLGLQKVKITAYFCLSQENATSTCSIQSKQQLSSSQKYQYIPLNFKSGISQIIATPQFCSNVYQQRDQSMCQILFVAQPQSDNVQTSHIQISVKKQRHTIKAKQGLIYYGQLYQSECNYYSHYATQNSNNYYHVFFLNKLTGSPILLSSQTIKKPSLDQYRAGNTDIKMNSTSITYQKSQGHFYIAICSQDYSNYMFTVSAHKHTESKQASPNPSQDIILEDGIALQFDLPVSEYQRYFTYYPSNDNSLDIKIVQLLGKVDVKIIYGNTKKQAKCQNPKICTVQAFKGQPIQVIVTGNKNEQQQFTILVTQSDQCYQFPMGSPLYASIDEQEDECLQIRLSKKQKVQIFTSLTLLQMLDEPIVITVTLISKSNKEKSPQFTLRQNTLEIDPKQYMNQTDCDKGQCYLNITFKSHVKRISFQLIAQYVDQMISLYDGVSQHIRATRQQNSVQYFSYYLISDNSLEMFISTTQNSRFKLIAKLVSRAEMDQSSNNQLFPQQGETGEFVWSTSTDRDSKSLTILTISQQKLREAINKKDHKTLLLVTLVFDESTDNFYDLSFQISQTQRTIYDGQTLVGFLQPGQITRYQLYIAQRSYLQIRPLLYYASESQSCLTIRDQDGKTLHQNIELESKGTRVTYITIQANKQTECPYQISLQNVIGKYKQITQGFSHSLEVWPGYSQRFLYYHNRDTSFKILQLLQNGDTIVYVTPLTNEQINSTFINGLTPEDYQHKSQQQKYLQVRKSDKQNQKGIKYCYRCFYLILVVGDPVAKQSILVTTEDLGAIIRQNDVVDDQLEINQKDRFLFYGNQQLDFFLSMDVVYGSVDVSIKWYSEQSETDIVESITLPQGTKVINMKKSQNTQKGTNRFSQLSKYEINVTANIQSSYHLQISQKSSYIHIVEGASTSFLIQDKIMPFLFKNYKTVDSPQILINFEHYFSHQYQITLIDTDQKSIKINAAVRKTGNLQVIRLRPIVGVYIIKIIPKDGTVLSNYKNQAITITIPRHDLTQLIPNSPLVFQHEAIFQIFIPPLQSAVIQLYDCSDSVIIRGSQNYDELIGAVPGPQENQLIHQNIAGHYVIHTQQLTGVGVYYLRVQSREELVSIKEKLGIQIQYLVRYFLLDENVPCPYMALGSYDDKVHVDFNTQNSNLTFQFSPIVKTQKNQLYLKAVEYKLIIAQKEQDILRKIVCFSSHTKVFFSAKQVQLQANMTDKILINASKSQVIQKIGNKPSYVGVIAQAHGISKNKQGKQLYFDQITFIYKPVAVSSFHKQVLIKEFKFVGWLLVIALVIGGGVFAYVLILNMIRIHRGYQQEMIELNQQGTTVQVPKIQKSQNLQNTSND